jgi:hypothetical protein
VSGLWFSISEICGPRAAPNLSQAVQQYKLFDAGAQLQLGFAHFVSFGYAIAVTFSCANSNTICDRRSCTDASVMLVSWWAADPSLRHNANT